MLNIINYDNLSSSQQETYNSIDSFGKSNGFSDQEIAMALNIAFVESSFGINNNPNLDAQGLYQYQAATWSDKATDPNKYLDIKETLKNWGYDPAVMDRFNNSDQTALFYADLKKYANEYSSGNLMKERNFNALLQNPSIKKQNLTEVEKELSYVYLRHNTDYIQVKHEWFSKLYPNINSTIEFLVQKNKQQITAAKGYVPPATRRDPLILDLDGDGVYGIGSGLEI